MFFKRRFRPVWGHSSVGRAPALQAGGRRFDPVCLHHRIDGEWTPDRPGYEDRWRDHNTDYVDRNERFALVPVPLSGTSGAGSWTSEDEVQVTED